MGDPVRIERRIAAPHGLAAALLSRAPRLALPFSDRCRSRLRARLSDGQEAALFLARGTILRAGDLLIATNGLLVVVEAQAEDLIEAVSDDPQIVLRAAYHLGNRHIRVELGHGYVRLENDPVLQTLLEGLGLKTHLRLLPFEPESGAYGGGHKHGHEASFTTDYALAKAAFLHHAHDHGPGSEHRHSPEFPSVLGRSSARATPSEPGPSLSDSVDNA